MIQFLQSNRRSNFFNSLLSQYETKGFLSERQLAAIDRAMIEASQPKTPKTFSMSQGQRIEVKAWLARRLQADLRMDFFFRDLEVVTVQNETLKAYHVTVKFVSQVVTNCHICGRDLDTEISRATGIGPVCADRLGIARPTLANANDTLKAIDELCSKIGSVGPIWIPKSQIKTGSDSK